MPNERLTPQLLMRRVHLRDLPAIVLPPGYALRHFRPGDEPAWEKIIEETFQTTNYVFDAAMKANACFRPERVWFITQDDQPVATASAWQEPRFGPLIGALHMVGVRPGHQGRQLGYWVSLAALHRFVVEGRIEAALQTDDFRLAAVKTYLRMGFEPVLVNENQRDRWRTIFTAISRPDLAAQFEPILNGPVTNVEGV
ncbi:MAG: GNAT family N-acetyltransferase [Planctomycetes bacterium]|nr:GNAT family N-acetyltransferase [Planctomycetota bacterium]